MTLYGAKDTGKDARHLFRTRFECVEPSDVRALADILKNVEVLTCCDVKGGEGVRGSFGKRFRRVSENFETASRVHVIDIELSSVLEDRVDPPMTSMKKVRKWVRKRLGFKNFIIRQSWSAVTKGIGWKWHVYVVFDKKVSLRRFKNYLLSRLDYERDFYIGLNSAGVPLRRNRVFDEAVYEPNRVMFEHPDARMWVFGDEKGVEKASKLRGAVFDSSHVVWQRAYDSDEEERVRRAFEKRQSKKLGMTKAEFREYHHRVIEQRILRPDDVLHTADGEKVTVLQAIKMGHGARFQAMDGSYDDSMAWYPKKRVFVDYAHGINTVYEVERKKKSKSKKKKSKKSKQKKSKAVDVEERIEMDLDEFFESYNTRAYLPLFDWDFRGIPDSGRTLVLVRDTVRGEELEKKIGGDARFYKSVERHLADGSIERYHQLSEKVGGVYDWENRNVVIITLAKYHKMFHELARDNRVTERLRYSVNRIVVDGFSEAEFDAYGVSVSKYDLFQLAYYGKDYWERFEFLRWALNLMNHVYQPGREYVFNNLAEAERYNAEALKYHRKRRTMSEYVPMISEWVGAGFPIHELAAAERAVEFESAGKIEREHVIAEFGYDVNDYPAAHAMPPSVADVFMACRSLMEMPIGMNVGGDVLVGRSRVLHPVSQVLFVTPFVENGAPVIRCEPDNTHVCEIERVTERELGRIRASRYVMSKAQTFPARVKKYEKLGGEVTWYMKDGRHAPVDTVCLLDYPQTPPHLDEMETFVYGRILGNLWKYLTMMAHSASTIYITKQPLEWRDLLVKYLPKTVFFKRKDARYAFLLEHFKRYKALPSTHVMLESGLWENANQCKHARYDFKRRYIGP